MKIRKNMPIVSTEKLDDVREFYTKHFAFKVTFDCPEKFLGTQSPFQ